MARLVSLPRLRTHVLKTRVDMVNNTPPQPIELATTDKTLTVREEDGELLMNSFHKPMYRTVFKNR